MLPNLREQRPTTPPPHPSISSSDALVLTPSQSQNTPRKHHREPDDMLSASTLQGSPKRARRAMGPSATKRVVKLPQHRTGAYRAAAIKALEDWRRSLRDGQYASGSFSIFVVLPDELIRSLAYDTQVQTVEQLKAKPSAASWPFLRRHGQDILDVLKKVDQDYLTARQEAEESRASKSARSKCMRHRPDENDEVSGALETTYEDEDDRLIESWSCKHPPVFISACVVSDATQRSR